MAKHGGFERMDKRYEFLTELIYERPGRTKGIAPTRAFLDGVMKYKATQSDWLKQTGKAPKNHFIYDEQTAARSSIWWSHPPRRPFETKALNKFKSIECQIMDWADDTAYPCTTLSTASTLIFQRR